MRLCQLLVLEAGPDCNYAERHPSCPTLDPDRFAGLDTTRRLDEDTMVNLAATAYLSLGFQGFVGFHYHNEPLLYLDLIERVAKRVRRRSRRARFLLWTNGSLITPENARRLRIFEWAVITDYDGRDFGFLRRYVPQVSLVPAAFDARRDRLVAARSLDRCVRPFTEFIVDCRGNVHICCWDWRGLASPGNVFTHDLGELVRRVEEIQDRVAGARMSSDAPDSCLRCPKRFSELDNFVPAVREETAAALRSDTVIAARRRQRACAAIHD